MTQRAPARVNMRFGAPDTVRATVLSATGIAFFSALCLLGAALRRFAEVEPGYGFLRWNLFLAWVPLVLAYGVAWSARRETTWPALPVLALAWIVFLPNAPYLITDLVHLREFYSVPNAVVLALLATTGLLIGVKSVQLVHGTVESLWGERAGWRAVQVVTVLVAFGVYLGRELRWNSWTIIQQPHDLASALARGLSEPGRVGLGALGIAVFAGCFYFAYRVLAGSPAAPLSVPRIGRGRPS